MFKFFDPNSECFGKYDAFCSRVFDVRAKGVRLIAMEEVRNYGKIVYIINIFEMAGGRMHAPHPIAPGHKLQKPSKESGLFQSLGTINFFFFTKRRSQKRWGVRHNVPLNTPLSLRLID